MALHLRLLIAVCFRLSAAYATEIHTLANSFLLSGCCQCYVGPKVIGGLRHKVSLHVTFHLANTLELLAETPTLLAAVTSETQHPRICDFG